MYQQLALDLTEYKVVNRFADLYMPQDRGEWMSAHQGLSAGMDLLDWKQFIVRAVEIIQSDENLERRIWKAKRLYVKAMKVQGEGWIAMATPAYIRQVIKQSEYELNG